MQKISRTDSFFMQQALKEALRGKGHVHPNPLVGALVVKENKIISRGAHTYFGGPHAEVAAIRKAGKNAIGGTLYSSLEPCTHFGKTPPCAQLILKSGLKKVVIGSRDPNPGVSGRGALFLVKKGLKIVTAVCQKEADELNKDFFHWAKFQTPYVVVKAAQSLDGKIATRHNESKWITGEKARAFGQELRSHSDAIVVGVNTVLMDNPRLNVRLEGFKGRQPYKIILDSRLRTPLNAALFTSCKGRVILATTKKSKPSLRRQYAKKAEVLVVKEKNGKVDVSDLFKILGKRGIVRVLVEGGGEVIADVLSKKLANECFFFIAPFIIGGKDAVSSVGGSGIKKLSHAYRFKTMEVEKLGEDILLHGVF